jgi:hypothetical protein
MRQGKENGNFKSEEESKMSHHDDSTCCCARGLPPLVFDPITEVDIFAEPYRQPTPKELAESREYCREFVVWRWSAKRLAMLREKLLNSTSESDRAWLKSGTFPLCPDCGGMCFWSNWSRRDKIRATRALRRVSIT